ncbi:MAG: glycosyltransferase family 4 protein [Butyrivibrio sp.]|nr:glycosyltransferase family 4 protein [Butyrivibrio sp.]
MQKSNDEKTWCVLFNCLNVHLIKEIGMIPWTMYKKYGFKGMVATYKNEEYTYLNQEVQGLEIHYIKRLTGNFKIDSVIWLLKNAKKCEVLQVFHISRIIMVYIALFHILNRRGKVYLKLDGSGAKGLPQGKRWERFYLKAIKYANVMSIEFKWALPDLQKKFGDKVIYIPNGYYSDGSKCNYSKKKNIICTCARLGTYQKNTELLLCVFAKAYKSIENWKLWLIGAYDDAFYEYYKEWEMKNPEAAEKTSLIGEIADRKELIQYYDSAKVFCLSSRWEGFSLAMIEAASRGDYLLVSDVGGAGEVIDALGHGELFASENETEFMEKMIMVCNTLEGTNADIYRTISEKAEEKYSWSDSCKRIYEKLYGII